MKSKNFLSNLWSRVAGSQRNDVEFDRRLTVGSPSGFTINWTLKLVSVLVLVLTIGSGNVWGDTYTITFKTAVSDPSGAISTSTAISTIVGDGASCVKSLNTCTKCYGPAISGLKLGSGSATGTFKFTLSDDLAGKTIKSVTIKNVKFGSDSGNITGTATGTNTGTLGTVAKGTDLVKDYGSSSTTKITTIQVATSAKRAYISQIIIETIEATPTTTVTASPASITFDDNTVEIGTDEATSKITLSNGYASYGNYLYGWFEDLSDEDHCEFFVNDGSTYSYSTSGSATPTLTFSYLADAAGTYTGKFIIQGYNSSYTAVNCTIPLSVTLTSSCANSVAIATGSPTNCTISASATSVSTCSGTKQVTISVTPNSCYAAPVKASVTSSGTTATWVSGPTPNSGSMPVFPQRRPIP